MTYRQSIALGLAYVLLLLPCAAGAEMPVTLEEAAFEIKCVKRLEGEQPDHFRRRWSELRKAHEELREARLPNVLYPADGQCDETHARYWVIYMPKAKQKPPSALPAPKAAP